MKQLSRNPFFYLSIVLGIVVAFEAVNLVRAQYAGPTAPPAGGQPAAPIDTSQVNQTKAGSFTTSKDLIMAGSNGTVSLSSTAGVAVLTFSSGNTFGKLWLTPADGKIMALSGGKTFEIGSGGGGTAPLILQTNSGGVGMILQKNPSDSSGNNSPILVFSGFGAGNIGVASQKSFGFLNDVISKAYAAFTVPCDADLINCGGSGGGGNSGGVSDTLTNPIWWMRQEDIKFSIYASTPDLKTDVRNIASFTRAGSVVANGFVKREQGGKNVPVTPSGTWCGLWGPSVTWPCQGTTPNVGCPAGWHQSGGFGKDQGLDNNWQTCIKD